jgi:hydrogenase expression/formation protein HypE
MALSTAIESDCAALHGLIAELLVAAPSTRFIRDATRGGLATVLNEAARASGVGIEISEAATPMREEVKAFCEILGLDPLYLVNEGKIACVVPKDEQVAALQALRGHPLGRRAAIVGRVAWPRRDEYRFWWATGCRHAGRRSVAKDLLRCTSWR